MLAFRKQLVVGFTRPLVVAEFLSTSIQKRAMPSNTNKTFQKSGADELRLQPIGQCSKDTPPLSKDDLTEGLNSIPSWDLNEASTQISRSFVAKNFVAAIKFFQEVADIAEEANHHPDLHLTAYRNVKVVLSTHAIGGLSAQDLIMAARIDALPVEYSPKWFKAQQRMAQEGKTAS